MWELELPAEIVAARVPSSITVCRIWPFAAEFDDSPTLRVPTVAYFRVSKKDAADAAKRSWAWPAISLWDLSRTTAAAQCLAAQRREIVRLAEAAQRNRAPSAMRVAYLACVADLEAIQTSGSPAFFPAHDPADQEPDPAAHVALFGLPSDESTPKRKGPELTASRDELVRCFHLGEIFRYGADGEIQQAKKSENAP